MADVIANICYGVILGGVMALVFVPALLAWIIKKQQRANKDEQ